ncbi:MAG: hypothetical protein KDC90_06420 [Ignavibacteriae bacterium]|nr:hypothetical protein [Ignavibacteriota bacterium]
MPIYTRYKLTGEFSYKPIQMASIERHGDFFEINVFPFLNLCGKYYIESSKKKILGTIVYRTMKSDGITSDVSFINGYNEFFISISPNGRLVSIYNISLEGIMLKA